VAHLNRRGFGPTISAQPHWPNRLSLILPDVVQPIKHPDRSHDNDWAEILLGFFSPVRLQWVRSELVLDPQLGVAMARLERFHQFAKVDVSSDRAVGDLASSLPAGR
jgi:hypothetical protein